MAAYAAAHGSTYPPIDTPLGVWAKNARQRYLSGLISAEKAEQVQQQVPGWVWRTRQVRRTAGLQAGIQTVAWQVANAGPITSDSEPRLIRLVRLLRRCYRQGILPPAAVQQLEAVPGWEWHRTIRRHRRWAARLPELEAFIAGHGYFPSTVGQNQRERQLASWWHRRHRAELSEADRQAAKAIEEDARLTRKWLQLFTEVSQLANDPAGITDSRASVLRRWLRHQQGLAALGHLSTRQRDMVSGITVPVRTRPRKPPVPRADPAATHEHRLSLMEQANRDRAADAAHRTVQQAEAALARPRLATEYGDVLKARIDHPRDNLAQLAGRVGMTKHAFAGRLRRALETIPCP